MEAQAAFPAELRSAAAARHLAERTLVGWGCNTLIEPTRLLVSELVVNAVIHAHTEVRLRLHLRPGSLRVEVSDGSTAAPRRRPYSPTATTGRGLMILDALADEWGVDIGRASKTVWFELAAASAAQSGTAG
jgi:anti-sigma regulatory factor (Ser/Thr protein kinase)